jgi:hypothetical protein
MQTIKAHPEDASQIKALKAFMKAMKIKFELAPETESPYKPEFVEKIKESRKELEEGNFKRVKKEDLKQFLGL